MVKERYVIEMKQLSDKESYFEGYEVDIVTYNEIGEILLKKSKRVKRGWRLGSALE